MKRAFLAAALTLVSAPAFAQDTSPPVCAGLIEAKVVALDQAYFWNRFGAVEPQGMIYALERDVVSSNSNDPSLQPGHVMLRPNKRARPLVLRMHAGGCLRIRFKNLLATSPVDEQQPATRHASIHVNGLQVVSSLLDDGSFVGVNTPSGIVAPGQTITYTLYAAREGTHIFSSMGAIIGGEGDSGSISPGLFGAVHVEPAGSEWYRSQVTREDLRLARTDTPSPTDESFPTINYNALYPLTHKLAGLPILRMTQNGEIVHGDLSAMITGPGAGNFISSAPTNVYPTRNEPFREFTVVFHDEIGAVQAFRAFEDPILAHTLHGGRDAFAINYGTGGIGAVVLANRLGVGPAHSCAECKYEEFFLTSWAIGDPAMIVDAPANGPCTLLGDWENEPCRPAPGPKATKAFFPDDPSNVFHSYLNDRVKIRNLHAGSDDHHVFHLHAHQWLHTPQSDLSSYLDSQTIGQGAAFTYEIAYEGGGNRNKTVGDSIFHCHFYPHFAQGMWGLWRVHDVLELGTKLDNDGKPAAGSRALPDGEIPAGTPIPAVVPIPTEPMAPLPAGVTIAAGQVQITRPIGKLITELGAGETNFVNPGYPFFIPGIGGRRPPHPPLDTIDDGGLARHVVVKGEAVSEETRLSFSKELTKATVTWLAEAGEPVEDLAMRFHELPNVPTPKPVSGTGSFTLNGRPRAPGAPFANPCPANALNRLYKAADIQIDTVLNKAGWHFPQTRMTALWEDVDDFLNPTPGVPSPRAPEPFFIRANSGECIEYQLTNLVPSEYHVDDFQVRSPTDILGQHIHLVKFDVTASDGAANGFNYEDGSFSPEEVQERICAIRRQNGCENVAPGECTFEGRPTAACPVPRVHPRFQNLNVDTDCDGHSDFLGAQTTVQRWWADPLLTIAGKDRTIRTVFTHDHFGPSTHQQAGLYGALLIEPAGSSWVHNETGTVLGGRSDGGPTTWQAVIKHPDAKDHREFALAFADFQLAYEKGSPVCPDLSPEGLGFADPARAINPAGRKLIGPPLLYEKPDPCPVTDRADANGIEAPPPPCPEIVSADDPGMVSVNYRNEPLALRIKNPNALTQASGRAGDLSFAYSSLVDRADNNFDVQPGTYPPLTRDIQPGDPWTPLLRAYEGDKVNIRIVVGAHEEEHTFNVHGVKWLAEPDDSTSGFRNAQGMGISEWFEFEIPRMPSLEDGQQADFLYKPSAASEWQWDGLWGLMRLYRGRTQTENARGELEPLRQNLEGRADGGDEDFEEIDPIPGVILPGRAAESLEAGKVTPGKVRVACPRGTPIRRYRVAAVAASEVLPDESGTLDTLVYNYRPTPVAMYPERIVRSGPLHDPTAILFVHMDDLTFVGSPLRPRMKPTAPREPLILRANAGECIQVILANLLPDNYQDLEGWNAMPMIVEGFNANQVKPSMQVGLHPQLVYYDVLNSDGTNVGLNETYARQTVAPGEKVAYHWYAGHVEVDDSTTPPAINTKPIAFGATGLSSSDPIKHSNKGAIGALIIEPQLATWTDDLAATPPTRAAANVVGPSRGDTFREFVLLFQDDVNLRYADNEPVESLIVNEDAQESAQKAINYRTDPFWFRIGRAPDVPTEITRTFPDYHLVLSNSFIGGQDPETPVFKAEVGEPLVFRVVHPGGHTQMHALALHSHIWKEQPLNPNSEWMGVRGGHGASGHFDAVIPRASAIAGDYLYRDFPTNFLDSGIWGILRLVP